MRPPALYDTELAGRLAGFERVEPGDHGPAAAGSPGWPRATARPTGPSARWPLEWLKLQRGPRRGTARRTARGDLGVPGRARQNRLGCTGIRLIRAPPWASARLHRRGGATAGGERRGSIGCVTREAWPLRFANCGRRVTVRRSAATSRPGASCRIRPSSTPRSPIRTPSRSSPPCRCSAATRQRRSAQVWLDALARARTTDDPPTSQEPSTGPPPASRWSRRKPEAAARLEAAPIAVSPNCHNGFRCRQRTSSPRRLCAGCAGTGSRCRPRRRPLRRSTSFCVRHGCGSGSANSPSRC